MFSTGDKIHVFSEEVGIVNGTYIGSDSVFCKKLGLHEFKTASGQLCMFDPKNAESGHHRRGKKSWRA